MASVGFLLYPGVTLMDFAGATQVFAFAGYRTLWIGPTANQTVRTTEGVDVLTNESFSAAPALDILFIPGGSADGVEFAMFDAEYQRFIARLAGETGWVGAVCVGAFILAAGHHLDHCQVTTYWSQLANLKRLEKPFSIQVPADYPRFLIDETRRRFSGGGVSSSMDLALALVARIRGREAAERAQLQIQYAPGPPTSSGDPSEASPVLVEAVRQAQLGFVHAIQGAVIRLLPN